MSNKLINAGNLSQALTAFYTKSTALFATKAELDSGLAGKANSSHGTHVTWATNTPKANGTAAIGSAARVAREDHVHPLQTSVSGNAGSANKVNTNLVIKLNSGSTEGTNLFTFNGSTAKTIDITPSSIGAAASSHGTHLSLGTTSSTAYRGDYGNTAYTHSQAAHAPSNAQKNSDITKAEIEAKLTGAITTHTHSYLPLSGGDVTGDLKLYASGSNDSPSLIFYRGSDSDSYTDWRIQDRGGSLYFDIRTGSTTFTNKMTFNENGTISATSFTEGGTALADKYAAKSHGTHLTLGTTSSTAYRGDYGNTAYNHSQAAHAPSNAQKNSDITKAEIEAKLTGTITSHNHSGTYAPASHNHESLTGITSLTFAANSDDSSVIKITKDSANSYTDFVMSDDAGTDMWRWRFKAWDSSASTTTAEYNLMTLKATSTTKGQLSVNGNITADSFTEGGTALSSKYAAASHGTHLTLGTGSGNAYRGDYGNTAYTHSQAAHAPSNAQKNSDITKAEIEAKLTGNSITTHGHVTVTGIYTSSGGAQPPSYISGGTVRFNMMNKFKGLSGLPTYADCILMDTYTGSDVPYVTGFGILKQSGDPRAFIAVGAKGNTTTWSKETELLTVANYKTHVTPANIGAAASSHGTHLTIGTGASNAAAGNHTHTAVNGYTIWTGTKAQYDAITSKSSTTLYFIKE